MSIFALELNCWWDFLKNLENYTILHKKNILFYKILKDKKHAMSEQKNTFKYSMETTIHEFIEHTKRNSQLCFTMEVLLRWNTVALSRDFQNFLSFLTFLAEGQAFELCFQLIKKRASLGFNCEDQNQKKLLLQWAKNSVPESVQSGFSIDLGLENEPDSNGMEEEEKPRSPRLKSHEDFLRDLQLYAEFYKKLKDFYGKATFTPGLHFAISTKWLYQLKTSLLSQEVSRIPPINTDEDFINFDFKGDLLPYLSNERYLGNLSIQESVVFPTELSFLSPDLWSELYGKYGGLEVAFNLASCDHRSRCEADLFPQIVKSLFLGGNC